MITEAPTKRPKLAVLKVRGGQAADLVISCDQVMGFQVHWCDGRSYVCPGEDCPACVQCWPQRWNGFLVARVIGPQTRAPVLLELSATSWDRLSGLMKLQGFETVERLIVSCQRRKPKSPLVVDPLGYSEETDCRIIKEDAAWSAISVLYQLPQPRPGESRSDWDDRASEAARRLIDLAMVRASR